jgi:hypothetical protein
MTTPVIGDRQNPKRPLVGQGIMHEIHAPAFRRSNRHRSRSSVQGDMFSAPDPHTELQALESIEPSHPLAIHEPTFAS